MEEKVYCKGCKYFREYSTGIAFGINAPFFKSIECHFPGNTKYVDKYISRNKEYKIHPEELNKDNNCQYYQEKLSIFKKIKNLFA